MTAESILEEYEEPQVPASEEGEDEVQAASAGDDVAHARLPFAFASNHGVMLDEDENEATLLYRPGLNLNVLLELQRYLGAEFRLKEIPNEDFQRRLTQAKW